MCVCVCVCVCVCRFFDDHIKRKKEKIWKGYGKIFKNSPQAHIPLSDPPGQS